MSLRINTTVVAIVTSVFMEAEDELPQPDLGELIQPVPGELVERVWEQRMERLAELGTKPLPEQKLIRETTERGTP